MKPTCRWVLKSASDSILHIADYCGMPVKYKLLKDDDQNVYRKYDTFCDWHKQIAEQMKYQKEDQID